jgi:hypothetical protein
VNASERALAERVREACRERFLAAFEEAGMLGLCLEGRLEHALSALKNVPIEALAEPKAKG